jgi:tRNA(adenine34) deaminase
MPAIGQDWYLPPRPRAILVKKMQNIHMNTVPTHTDFMKIALEEAALAGEAGEVPVGAVLVADGKVLAQDHNRRDATGDPSAHAEILVMRAAGEKARDWRLEGATLYVTLEPCAMCAGAAALARVKSVVFGASDPVAGAGGSAYNILEDGKLGHRVEVQGGIMEDECREVLARFFEGLR